MNNVTVNLYQDVLGPQKDHPDSLGVKSLMLWGISTLLCVNEIQLNNYVAKIIWVCLKYTAYGDMAAATTEEGILQIAAITSFLESFSTIISDHTSIK